MQLAIPLKALRSTSARNIAGSLDIQFGGGSAKSIDLCESGVHVVLFLNPDNASGNVGVAGHMVPSTLITI